MKALTWAASVVLGLFIACLGFLYLSPEYELYLVRSESMKPTINMGDLIVVGPPNGLFGVGLGKGTIVTYQLGKSLVTHRVVSLSGNTLTTRGDALEEADPRPVIVSQVKGTYLFKVPYAGYLTRFIRTKSGWFLSVIAPAIVLVALIAREIVKEALSGGEVSKGEVRP